MTSWTRSVPFLDEVRPPWARSGEDLDRSGDNLDEVPFYPLDLVHHIGPTAPWKAQPQDLVHHLKWDLVQKGGRPRPKRG